MTWVPVDTGRERSTQDIKVLVIQNLKDYIKINNFC